MAATHVNRIDVDATLRLWSVTVALLLIISGCSWLVEKTEARNVNHMKEINKYEFYVQVVRSHFTFSNSTAILVSTVGIMDPSSPSAFGGAIVFDDKITEGPDFFSKEVGRIKGVYFQACHNITNAGCPKILVVSTLDFTAGKLIGTLPVTFLEYLTIPVRTYAFYGGTGDFLSARGVGIVTPTLLADGYLRSHTVLHIES